MNAGRATFRVVQPRGVRPGEFTVISEHATASEAFAAIDRLAEQMVRTGAPSDAVRLVVVDGEGRELRRRNLH